MLKEKRNYKLDHKLKFKSDDLLWHLHEYDVDLQSNHIYLMGVDRGYDISGMDEPGIEYVIAKRFIKNFNLCMRVNPNKPILIHMKTNGGLWEEGMAIFDTIRACPWLVTILNYTHARSMSSIILQAANKRVMMPNSTFMFHDGTYMVDGTTKQVRSAVKFDRRVADKTMLDIYVNSMKQSGSLKTKTEAYIKKWLRSRMDKEEDVYMTAKEAIEVGFADEIFDGNWQNLTNYTEEQEAR